PGGRRGGGGARGARLRALAAGADDRRVGGDQRGDDRDAHGAALPGCPTSLYSAGGDGRGARPRSPRLTEQAAASISRRQTRGNARRTSRPASRTPHARSDGSRRDLLPAPPRTPSAGERRHALAVERRQHEAALAVM